jgi:hypothetical protein
MTTEVLVGVHVATMKSVVSPAIAPDAGVSRPATRATPLATASPPAIQVITVASATCVR